MLCTANLDRSQELAIFRVSSYCLLPFRYSLTILTLKALNNLNFDPLEVVSRYRDPQLQVGRNYSYVFNLGPNICKC